jgi:hypothetical protein
MWFFLRSATSFFIYQASAKCVCLRELFGSGVAPPLRSHGQGQPRNNEKADKQRRPYNSGTKARISRRISQRQNKCSQAVGPLFIVWRLSIIVRVIGNFTFLPRSAHLLTIISLGANSVFLSVSAVWAVCGSSEAHIRLFEV